MVKKSVKIEPVVEVIEEVVPIKKVKNVKKVKTDEVKKVKKTNPWLLHIAEFRKNNPTLSYKDCLKEGKKTYKKDKSIPAKPVPIKKAPADSIKSKKEKVKKVVKTKTKPKQTLDK